MSLVYGYYWRQFSRFFYRASYIYIVMFCALSGCQTVGQSAEGVLDPEGVYGTKAVTLTQRLDPALIDIETSSLCQGPKPYSPKWYQTVGESGDTNIQADVYQTCSIFAPSLLAILSRSGISYRLISEDKIKKTTVGGIDSYGKNMPVEERYMPRPPSDFIQARYLIEITGPKVDYTNLGNGFRLSDAADLAVWDLHTGAFIGVSSVNASSTFKVIQKIVDGISGDRCALTTLYDMDCEKGFALEYLTAYPPKHFGLVQTVNVARSNRPIMPEN